MRTIKESNRIQKTMGFISRGSSKFLLLLVATSLVATAIADKVWPWGVAATGLGCWSPSTCFDPVPGARTIVVGNTSGWTFGFDYMAWIQQIGPLFVGDTLVFNYATHHSVYLMKDLGSFINCSMDGATMIGSTSAGGGSGFKVTLQPTPPWQPYLFACGEKNGIHCNLGKMKFAVWAWPRMPPMS